MIALHSIACSTMSGVVRERASHELECPEDDLEVDEIGGTSFVASGCGRSGTYTCADSHRTTGRQVVCVRDDPPPSADDNSKSPAQAGRTNAEPSSSARVTNNAPPPPGAAGFEFGAKGRAVQAACTEAGFEWTAIGRTKYRCSGAAKSVDLADVSAELWFCKGALCGIFINGKPLDEGRWTSTAVNLYEALVAKYGQPSERHVRIPASCTKSNDAGPDCIAAGQASLRVSWSWPTTERIMLFVGIPDGSQTPAVQLSYTSPRSAPQAEGL